MTLTQLLLAGALPVVAGCAGPGPRPAIPQEAADTACAVPGKAVQWIADYCLFKEETDDLIAASDCIEREQARVAADDGCTVATRYKSALCNLHLSAGLRAGTLEACINDVSFSGNIVRNDGSP